jgi:hypothetical protein
VNAVTGDVNVTRTVSTDSLVGSSSDRALLVWTEALARMGTESGRWSQSDQGCIWQSEEAATGEVSLAADRMTYKDFLI